MPPIKKKRNCSCVLNATYFKPQGIPLRDLNIIELEIDEVEALRLTHIENLSQLECGKQMNVSRQTVQRTLEIAHKKITRALISGYAIKINLPENK